MAGSRKSKLLVPESYDAMTRFKMECAEEIGHLDWVKENNDHYKGDVPAKVNGQQGGPIGGMMVKKMIRSYEEQMK
ncbi:MAG: small, acid-soluble spore protein, alpha/beta type [Clostridia bacterium]